VNLRAAHCQASPAAHYPPCTTRHAPLHTDTRRSAACFVGWAVLFLPWTLLYLVAGRQLISASVYEALDAYRIDLASLGIGL
jgi:hypothetical protein